MTTVTDRYIYTNSVDGFPLIIEQCDTKQYESLVLKRIDERLFRKQKTDTTVKEGVRLLSDLLPKYYVNSAF
jgi:hypothetical protein